MFLKLQFVKKKFFLKDSFRISRENKTFVKTIIIKLTENDRSGFAECVPYKRYGETQKKIFSYLKNNQHEIKRLTRQNRFEEIKYLSLRTALELASKHLNIKKNNQYNLRKKYLTSITIPIFNQDKLNKIVRKFKDVKLIKVKVNKNNILKTIKFINKKCPKSKIIIDANEGMNFPLLKKIINDLEKLNVIIIEQPFKYGLDYKLKNIKTKILFCADESFHIKNKSNILKYYQVINLKMLGLLK